MNAFSPTVARMAAKADAEDRVYLPDSNTEMTGFFKHDTELGTDRVFHASLIGLLIDDEPLTTDEAVDRYGLAQVTAWEWASVALANEDRQ